MAYAPVSFTYVGFPASKTINLTFPILNRSHVKVFYGGVEQLNNNSIYRFNSDSQIVLVAPPATGTLVKVSRATPAAPLVSFQAGAVIPVADLNTATQQALFRVEELLIESTTSVAYADLVGVPATFPPATHTHNAEDVFDSGIVPPDYLGEGSRNGTRFLRDDSVWADPPSATGQWGTITGTLTDQSDIADALASKAQSVHTHAISNVTGLQDALDAKLATVQAGTLGLTILGSVAIDDVRHAIGIYVQATDPGVLPDGSIWIQTS